MLVHDLTSLEVRVVEMDNASLLAPVLLLDRKEQHKAKTTYAVVLITSFSSEISPYLPC